MDKALRGKVYEFLKIEFAYLLRKNAKKGYKLKDFNIQPFTLIALAGAYFSKPSSENMAKALVYPRAFGTSINTTFGNKLQKMCMKVLGAKAASAAGMDLEFEDKISGVNVMAQLKAGPNTINSKDVSPMIEEFKKTYRLLRTNGVGDKMPIFAVCILYGSISEVSSSYRNISKEAIGSQLDIPIYIGQDFWYRLTGIESFYSELIEVFFELFKKENYAKYLNVSVKSLARELEQKYFTNGIIDPSKFIG